MGLNFDLASAADVEARIQVVCKFDATIAMTEDQYDAYIASGADVAKLTLKKGKTLTDCTLFILRKNLDLLGNEKVLRKQFIIDPITKQPTANPAFIIADIQNSLVDVINPEGAEFPVNFKEDQPGLASRKLVLGLYNTGILMDLFTARQKAAGGAKSALIEKKS